MDFIIAYLFVGLIWIIWHLKKIRKVAERQSLPMIASIVINLFFWPFTMIYVLMQENVE